MKNTPSKKPCVLMLLTNCFDPDPRVLAEAKALVRNGYAVHLLAWDRDRKCAEHENVEGIEVHRIYVSSTHGRGSTQAVVMIRVLWALIRRGLSFQFDAVHAHDFDTLPAGVVLAKIRKKPLIYDSHENYTAMLHGSIPAVMEKAIFATETRLLRSVDMLITVGEILKDEFVERGARNCVVVGNWKNLSEYRLDDACRREMRGQLQIPTDALVIAFIANLGRERKVEQLIEAARSRPDIHFLFGGKGTAAKAVEEAATALPNVHYAGFVHPSQLGRYTWASDVVFYGFDTDNPNSKYSAPNKLFEALAGGKALLTGDFGEIGRIVKQYGCGILVNDFSAKGILKALEKFSRRNELLEMQSRASEIGERTYNWESAEATLVAGYRGLTPSLDAPSDASNDSMVKQVAAL